MLSFTEVICGMEKAMDKRKNMELQGYDVFGKAYGVMMRNDLHAPEGIDHKLLQKMILLNDIFFHTRRSS